MFIVFAELLLSWKRKSRGWRALMVACSRREWRGKPKICAKGVPLPWRYYFFSRL